MNSKPHLRSLISKTPAHYWWRGFFFLFTIFSLFALLRHDFSGHFRTFVEAARRIHQGITPYGSDFGIGVGKFFYSPTAALYFFRAFLAIPEKLGLALYVILSTAIYFWGATSYLDSTEQGSTKNRSHWIIALSLPQVYAAIIAAKLELLMVGILLICIAAIQKNPKNKIAPFFLALPIAWKYQPLPIFGLISIASILFREPIPLLYTLAGLVFWFLLPVIELGFAFYFEILRQMQSTLSEFTAQAYANFDNLFATFHLPLEAFIFLVIFGVFAALGALIYFIEKKKLNWSDSIEMAFVLGSAFIVLLSPLQQNNAYILWVPILFSCAKNLDLKSKIQIRVFGFLWIWVALGYSDLMPLFIRVPFRENALKPLFTLIFVLFTLSGVIPYARRRLKSQSSH